MKSKPSFGRTIGRIGLGLVVVLGGAVLYLFWPVSANALASHPNPVASYEEAVRRVTELQAKQSGLNPLCKAQLLSHGKKTGRVIVLVHGYTNCPAQYSALAPQLFEGSSNILLLPLPRHGLAERMNEDQSLLTADEIAAYADEAVDIAAGLGDQIVMVGISMGGVTTAFAAQNRSEIYRAVVISPAFGFKVIPAAMTTPAMRAYMALPNSYTWWDPVGKDAPGAMDYAYPRYSSRALAQTLRIGQNVIALSRKSPIKAGSMIVVTNANDESINLDMITQVTNNWQKLAPHRVSTYQFPASLKVKHDIIDANQDVDVVHLVYPKLIELIQAP